MEESPPHTTHAGPVRFPAGAFSTAGAFHPDHRPERPFPEEDPGSDGDGFLKPGLQPPSQLDGLKHFLHQVSEGPPILPRFLLPFLILSPLQESRTVAAAAFRD